MRLVIVVTVLAVAVPTPAVAAGAPPPCGGGPDGRLAAALASVARVEVLRAQGSGVLVSPDTLVTAAHVVADAPAAKITWADGTTTSGEVRGRNVATDLAVLNVQSAPAGACVASAAVGPPSIGEAIHAAGHALGDADVAVREGNVLEHDTPGTTGWTQIDATVDRGMSGGPVFDSGQQVVGIVVAIPKSADDTALVASTGHIADIIDSRDQPTAAGSDDAQPLDPSYLVALAVLGLAAGVAVMGRRRQRAKSEVEIRLGPPRPCTLDPVDLTGDAHGNY